jgi:hypothetical protein
MLLCDCRRYIKAQRARRVKFAVKFTYLLGVFVGAKTIAMNCANLTQSLLL